MRDVMTHRGPDDSGISSTTMSAGPSPSEHCRRCCRSSADDQRRRVASRSLTTAKSTTTLIFAQNLEAARSRLQHPLRYRNHPSPLRRTRRGCVNISSRHVCFRDLGPRRRANYSSLAIGWESSHSTTPTRTMAVSTSPRNQGVYFRAGAVKPQINYPALPDYLANHATSGEETLYRGVKTSTARSHARPGAMARSRSRSTGTSVSEKTEDGANDQDYIAEWSELFRTSVRLRLMADVPLGMFLSGGIDSSAIAAVMSGMVDEPIKTFSVAFAEREANELELTLASSQAYKTNHHEVVVSPEEFFHALPKLVWHEDEPLAHPSSVALYFVSLLASRARESGADR